MKTKSILAVAAAVLSLLALSPSTQAADIPAINSGNWTSTVPNFPWPDGTVPATNDSVFIDVGIEVTVDSTATIAVLDGDGTVTLTPGATLNILGAANGGSAALTLGTLNATATGATVNYKGNPFWAKRTDYYNLIFSGVGDFYNGVIPGSGAVAINVLGDMTLSGTNVAVQQGADISITGNLMILGATNKWDTSSFNFTVSSNTFLTGTRDLLVDLDGAAGLNNFQGNMTVGSNVLAWNVSDVIYWRVGGSLTNQGLIAGKGYGSISFGGTGVITGKPFKLPTITIDGTYLIGTTITLATNTPTLNGTMIFDIAATNQIVMQYYPLNPLTFFYAGNLEVINSGAAPISGSSFKFFNATNYAGTFFSTTLPTLPGGLSWVDNLATSGSIAVTGGGPVGAPSLSLSRNNLAITLSWDSTTYPGYSVLARTNSAGIGNTGWNPTGSGTVSPFVTTVNPSGPSVFYRLYKP